MKFPFQNQQIKQELKLLRHNLKKTLKHIKTTYAKFSNKPKQHPWFFVIGPSAAGKSSLLTKSELSLNSAQGTPVSTIAPTKYYDWRLAENAVFLDIGGNTIESEIQTTKSLIIWQGLIKLIHRYRWRKPIDGLLVVLNLHAFQQLTKTQQKSQLDYLHAQMQALAYSNKELPTYFIFSQCDQIEGFSDFFADLSHEERQQAWGMEFSSAGDKNISDLLEEKFNALLKRLNDRLIWRMHHEYDLEKRSKIKEFPLQLESLKQPTIDIINALAWGEEIKLRGVYFTSSIDQGNTTNYILPSISKAFALETNPKKETAHLKKPQDKAYFIHNLLKDIVIPTERSKPSKNKSWKINKTYFFGLGIFVFISLIAYLIYEHDVHVLQNMQQILAQNDTPLVKNNSLKAVLEKLNIAYKAHEELKNAPWYQGFEFPQLTALKKQANQTYEKLLDIHFKLSLKKILETQIRQENNPSKLYAALKIYLMLGDKTKIDEPTIQLWFVHYWEQGPLGKAQQKQFKHYLTDLLNAHYMPIELNQLLINNARENLHNIPLPQLAYLSLQDEYEKTDMQLLNQNYHALFTTNPKIPLIYTAQSFSNVYNKKIADACQKITKGNWILGTQIKSLSMNFEQCILAARAIYINDYATTWNQTLNDLKIVKFTNIKQAAETTKALIAADSTLMQLLSIVKANTAILNTKMPEQTLTFPFNELNKLTTELAQTPLYTELTKLNNYMEKLAKVPDPAQSAFRTVAHAIQNPEQNPLNHLTTIADRLPLPLQTWVKEIATNTQTILLENTRSYLNQIWAEKVFPVYNRYINNRYPLFPDAKKDIELEYFAKFFSPKGVLETFFKNYLKPFADTSNTYWTWKKFNGETIGIPQETLEMFIRASLIQKMYFADEDKPLVRFSLLPLELSANVQAFTLTTPEQKVVFQTNSSEMSHMTWPTDAIEIRFTDHANQQQAFREAGPWSLFKILDKSLLEPTSHPKRFDVTFELNGNKAKFELLTQDIVSPFIPHMLSNFRCPENL